MLTATLALTGLVFVVDAAAGPGFDFTDIQPAVDAAGPGDIVLVRDGTYGGFTIDGKGISVVAEQGASVFFSAPVTVQACPADEDVLLRGLDVAGGAAGALFGATTHAVTFHLNEGDVWVEDCTLAATAATPFSPAQDVGGADIFSSVVSFQRCTLWGQEGLTFVSGFSATSLPGDTALRVDGGSASLDGCTLIGGAGGDGVFNAFDESDGAAGGSALLIDDGYVFLRGCTVVGGVGGDGAPGACGSFPFGSAGGDGGTGLETTGVSQTIQSVDTAIAGGSPGLGTCGEPDGIGGLDTDVGIFELQTFPLTGRGLVVDATVDAGTSVGITFTGLPGDFALLGVSTGHTFQSFQLFTPPFVVLPTTPIGVFFPLGTVPGSGTLASSLPVPLLPALTEGAVLYTQGTYIDASAQPGVAQPSATVILAPGV